MVDGTEEQKDDTTCGRCGRKYEVTSKGVFYCTCWTPSPIGIQAPKCLADQIFDGSEDIDYNGD